MSAAWPMPTVSEFAKTSAGGTPKKSNADFYEGGAIPWLLSGEVGVRDIIEAENFITDAGLDGSSAKLFPPNSVLVAMYGATAGEVGILRFEAATNQAVCAILPGPSHVPEYLYYYFLLAKPLLVAQAIGNAQPNISQAKIKALPIPLPPLEEQKRIVAVLDQAFAALDRARANAEANLADAEELFESYGEALFTETIASTCRSVPLGELTSPGSGITYGVVKPGGEGAVAFVRGGDLINGKVRLDKLRTISKEFSEQYKRTLLQGGELLICLVGTPGQCAIAPTELAGANIARQVGMVRLRSDLNAQYIRDYLLSKVGQDALGLRTGGSVQQVINLGDLKLIEIPLPEDSTQAEIVNRLLSIKEATAALKQRYTLDLNDLDDLRQSILQKAFAGELT